jgi:hypothetical protein
MAITAVGKQKQERPMKITVETTPANDPIVRWSDVPVGQWFLTWGGKNLNLKLSPSHRYMVAVDDAVNGGTSPVGPHESNTVMWDYQPADVEIHVQVKERV